MASCQPKQYVAADILTYETSFLLFHAVKRTKYCPNILSDANARQRGIIIAFQNCFVYRNVISRFNLIFGHILHLPLSPDIYDHDLDSEYIIMNNSLG